MTSKRCRTCREIKLLNAFPKAKGCKDGHRNNCSKCVQERQRLWRMNNPGKARTGSYRADAAMRERHGMAWFRAKTLFIGMRKRSEKIGLPFDSETYSVAYLTRWLEQKPFCECCHQPLQIERFEDDRAGLSRRSPSMDRIVPSKGYVKGNVALLCFRCNSLKRDAPAHELLQVAHWLQRATEPGAEHPFYELEDEE